jgi:hypothetical protein
MVLDTFSKLYGRIAEELFKKSDQILDPLEIASWNDPGHRALKLDTCGIRFRVLADLMPAIV